MEQNVRSHSVNLEYRQGLTASGINDVIAFDEKDIVLSVSNGAKMRITGENLKILNFDKPSGNFRLSGSVYVLKYSVGEKFGLKKLFK